MSAALAISLPHRAHASAANDNTPVPPVRTKVHLRLAAQRRFDSQDQIPRRVYDHMGKLAYSHKESDGEGVTPIRLQSGQMIAKWTGTKLTYMHTNHLGTPVAGTHGSPEPTPNSDDPNVGDVVFRDFYTPFGLNPTSGWHDNATSGFVPPFGPGSNAGVTGFTDHVKDVETGLTYMQARHYDPVAGRFLSIDPVDFMQTGDPSQFNRYSYVGNDPLNFIDPSGMIRCSGAEGSCDQVHEAAETAQKRIGSANDALTDLKNGLENNPDSLTDSQQATSDALNDMFGKNGSSLKNINRVQKKLGKISKRIGEKGTGMKVNVPNMSSKLRYALQDVTGHVDLFNEAFNIPAGQQFDLSGVLIHEAGHNGVPLIGDFAYGYSRSKALASKRPYLTRTNIDSHACFISPTMCQP